MKIKNLDVTKTGIIILTSTAIAVCSGCGIKKPDNFNQVLEENNIIPISQIDDIPEYYYMVKISDPVYDDGNFHFNEHWEHIDSTNNATVIAREYDADYSVLKIDFEDGIYKVHKKRVEDIKDRPKGYDYVFKNDYLIMDDSSYEDVYLIEGKVLKRE